MKKRRYTFKALIERVVDGDTFDCVVDLGFRITTYQRFRLRNINTPEIRGEEREEGLKVKEYVESLVLGKEMNIETFKIGKYGRYIVEIYLENGEDLSRHLLGKGMGEEYMVIPD
jgi:micrococcal nuclease